MPVWVVVATNAGIEPLRVFAVDLLIISVGTVAITVRALTHTFYDVKPNFVDRCATSGTVSFVSTSTVDFGGNAVGQSPAVGIVPKRPSLSPGARDLFTAASRHKVQR